VGGMKDFLHTLVYSIALGVICATALTAASRLTADLQKANKEAEKARNVMKVLGITDFDKYSEVTKSQVNGIPAYKYNHPTDGPLTAVEFSGPGLWGPIHGLLCLKADMDTIYAISFYEQEETPGLGGEIGTEDFRSRFRGKRTTSATGGRGIVLRRTGAVGPNEVDAITGATMTCNKVESMLNLLIKELNKNGK